MKRAYIIGAGGMLGRYVYEEFSKDHVTMCTDIDVNEEWLTLCDVRDSDELRKQVFDFRPDILINLAAITNLERAEADPTECHDTNALGAVNCLELSIELGIPYIFISTAGIFDGKKDSYTEFDPLSPVSVYGKSKATAESLLMTYDQVWIYRAGWMIGGGKKDKKFVGMMLDQLDKGADVLSVVNDKFGTPTYAKDFARSMHKHNYEMLPFGIYNMAGLGVATREDVAREMLEILDIEDTIEIQAVSSSHFEKTFTAPRPTSEVLIDKKLNDQGRNCMRDWREALRDYINNEIL